MAHGAGPVLVPQWHDYSGSEVDFTAMPGQQIHPTVTHRSSVMQNWQPQVTPGDMVDEPLPYGTGQGEFANSSFYQDSYIPPNSRVPSMVSTDTVGSTARSPSYASISSFSPELANLKASCPLVTGQSKECIPEFCGIDAPCLTSVNPFPEIEESDLTPCVQRSYLLESSGNATGQQGSTDISSQPKIESRDISLRDRREPKRPTATRASSSGPRSDDTGRTKGRQAHSLVERKYRENLNSKIDELHDALRKTRSGSMTNAPFSRPAPPFGSANRARKGDILSEALNYIYQSQVDMRHMAEELARCKAQVAKAEQTPNKCDDCSIRKQVMNLRLLADGVD